MSETDVTNLDRLRAVTEHVRIYPDLDRWVSQVGIMRRVDLTLYAPTLREDVDAIAQWAVSIGAHWVEIRGGEDNYHLRVEGTLAGGMDAEATVVATDAEPLKADGIEPGDTVPLERIVTLQGSVA